MAKHPHRVMLINKKTWRCTLPGCSFFVHLGLAHVLLGKQGICWECGEQFTLEEELLKIDQPICYDCVNRSKGKPSMAELAEANNALEVLRKHGVKYISELTPYQIDNNKMLGKLTDNSIKRLREMEANSRALYKATSSEEDHIEVSE